MKYEYTSSKLDSLHMKHKEDVMQLQIPSPQ